MPLHGYSEAISQVEINGATHYLLHLFREQTADTSQETNNLSNEFLVYLRYSVDNVLCDSSYLRLTNDKSQRTRIRLNRLFLFTGCTAFTNAAGKQTDGA